MASRPLSVIAAVRQPEDIEDMAETRAQLANAKYTAARYWEALLDSRKVCTQVHAAHAELQSELQRSARNLRILEKELKNLNEQHKEFVRAYANVKGSSHNIETQLRQEIEAADMLRGKMQQGYKGQLHEQQGFVAELRQENKCLMEDKAALIEEVARLRRQLDIVQSSRATPSGSGNMARSSLALGISGSPLTSFAASPTSGVASLSGADSTLISSSVANHKSGVFSCLMEDVAHVTQELSRGANTVRTPRATPAGPANMVRSLSFGGATSIPSADSPTLGFVSLSAPDSPRSSSSVASHDSDVFDCLMQDVARVAQELSKGASLVQTPRATPAGPANMASPPFASTPSPQQRAMLTTPNPLPVYEEGQMVVHRCVQSGVQLAPITGCLSQRQAGLRSSPCPDPLKVTVRGLPVTYQNPSSPLEMESSPAELDADAAASTSNNPTPSVSPVGTLHSAFLSEMPSARANVEAQVTMSPSPDSPKVFPLVNRSQSLTLAVKDLACVTEELSRGANTVQTPRATPARPANMLLDSEASSWHGQLHDSNPLRVTFRRGAQPSGPIPLFALASPSPHPFSFIPPIAMPLLVPSALAADMVGGSSPISTSLSRPSSPSGAGPLLAASCALASCPDIPLEVTVRGAPVISQVPSSPLEVESSPAELYADAAADTSSSPSPLASPITSITSALLSKLPSPMACVEALCDMGTPSEGPKPSPLVNMSPRPALTNLTNGLTPQARVTPGLAASAQTPGKATPPTPAARRHLSAFLQRFPSPCPRPRTSFPRVVVTGNRSASSIRSSGGVKASPGNPPALDLLSPARALGNMPRAVSTQVVSPLASIRAFLTSPTASSPPRAVGSHLTGSLLGARAFSYTPTGPLAEPSVSVHSLMPAADQRFSLDPSLPEAQSSPAVQPAVSLSSAALAIKGKVKAVKKEAAPTRSQPARRAKDPGHTWKF
ncbi:hypothetical protein WJX82_009137 [Trebouxia sp. C0006]